MAEGIGTGSGAVGRLAPTSIGPGGNLVVPERRRIVGNIGVVRGSRGLAGAFGAIAGAAREVAVQEIAAERRRVAVEAERRGLNEAVVRDQDGNLTVRRMPDDTVAGRAFNRGAEAAYLAQFELDARRRAAELGTRHRADPDAFRAAWSGYLRGVAKRVPEELRGAALRELDRIGVQTETALLDERFREDRRLQQDAIDAELAALQTDMANLASAGRADTPEYTEAAARLAELLDAAVDAGFMPRERADIIRAAQADEDEARTIAADALEAYHAAGGGPKGIRAARERLDRLLADPELAVPQARRRSIANAIEARIADAESLRRLEARRAAQEAERDLERLRLGYPLPAGTLQQHVRALRRIGEDELADRLVGTAARQQEMAAFARLPLDEQRRRIIELDSRLREGAGVRGDIELLDAMQRAFEAKRRALQKDPLDWAERAGVVERVSELDWSSPTALRETLGQRVNAVAQIAAREGIEASPLREPEIDRLAGVLETATAAERLSVLDAFRDALPADQFRAVLEKVAGKSAPTVAFAAGLGAADRDAAEQVLKGLDLARADPKLLPKQDADWRGIVSRGLGEAFGHMPGYLQAARGATRAAYAALAAAEGDLTGELDEDRLRRAIGLVTGGLVEWRDRPLPPPVRGMDQDTFEALLEDLRDEDLGPPDGRPVSADGKPVTAETIREFGELLPSGDGRYLVTIEGFAVTGPDGGPWELDLRGAAERRRDAAGVPQRADR